MAGYPHWIARKRGRERHIGGTPHDNGGRNQSDASINQGMPGLPATQKLRQRQGTDFPPEPSERELAPADTLISEF